MRQGSGSMHIVRVKQADAWQGQGARPQQQPKFSSWLDQPVIPNIKFLHWPAPALACTQCGGKPCSGTVPRTHLTTQTPAPHHTRPPLAQPPTRQLLQLVLVAPGEEGGGNAEEVDGVRRVPLHQRQQVGAVGQRQAADQRQAARLKRAPPAVPAQRAAGGRRAVEWPGQGAAQRWPWAGGEYRGGR